MADSVEITTATGLPASEERVTFLERFFDEINREAAAAYEYVEARVNGELAGVAAISRPDDVAYIKLAFLYVAEEYRRNGVAAALVDAIRGEAERETVLAKAHLSWRSANQFYQQNGWQHLPERSTGLLNAYSVESS